LLTADLKNLLQTAELIITVGNDLRSDDGLGPHIFKKCRISNIQCPIINAGNKPENIIEEAVSKKPKKVVIIDAADFGGEAGATRIIPNEHIPDTTLSTHAFPLKIIARVIEEDTKATVYFLGVQPKNVGWGEGLSPEVKKIVDEITSTILER